MEKKRESIRIFKSGFLEIFTHVHPLTPLIIWTPVVGWFLWHSQQVSGLSLWSIGSLGLSGFLFWTLAEYTLHRFIFHLKPKNHLQKRFQFIIHGLHHDDPVDPTRLVMPPFAAIVLAVFFYFLFRLFLGPVWVEPFFAFFLIGYLCYDYTHYSIHHFKPRTKVGQYLKQNHMIHHYAHSHSRWGVSSPLWDFVFGTYEEGSKEAFEKEHFEAIR